MFLHSHFIGQSMSRGHMNTGAGKCHPTMCLEEPWKRLVASTDHCHKVLAAQPRSRQRRLTRRGLSSRLGGVSSPTPHAPGPRGSHHVHSHLPLHSVLCLTFPTLPTLGNDLPKSTLELHRGDTLDTDSIKRECLLKRRGSISS